MFENESLDEILAQYTSKEAVKSANRERERLEEDFTDTGVLVKDYPQPQRELDLHEKTVPEALSESRHFIDRSINQRIRTIRLVTGRGLHSKNMIPVLPGEIEKMLLEMRRNKKILSFKRDRTGGAFIVYLIS